MLSSILPISIIYIAFYSGYTNYVGTDLRKPLTYAVKARQIYARHPPLANLLLFRRQIRCDTIARVFCRFVSFWIVSPL